MSNMESAHNRNSGVELLRFFGMVSIYISHSIPLVGEIECRNGFISFINPANSFFNIFVYCGCFGNAIFAIIAAYYLCDSNRVKVNKLLLLIFNSFLISVIFLLGFLIAGYRLPADIVARQFFPTILGTLHFITRYVVLYLFHPLINWALMKIKFKGHLIVAITAALSLITTDIVRFYLNTWTINSAMFSMLVTFIIVSFFKHYIPNLFSSKRTSFIVFIVLMLLSLTPFIILCFYPDNTALKFLTVAFMNLYSPFYFLSCYAIFKFFEQLKFYFKPINYVSSCSIIGYCTHANYLFITYFTPTVKGSFVVYDGGMFEVLYAFAYCGMLLIFGYTIAIFYHNTINRLTSLAATKLSIPIENISQKAIQKVQHFYQNHK